MKLSRSPRRGQAAFTLPEVFVTGTISMLVIMGLLTIYLFGLRLFEFTEAKLSASDNSRNVIGNLANEIRSATTVKVGSGSKTAFAEVPVGSRQEGNAIQVYPTTNTAHYVRYFRDASDQQLKRMTNGALNPRVIANCISNSIVFSSEDSAGQVITDNQNNRVIGVYLQFYQLEYPIIKIGTNQFFDYFQLRTKITRRKIL